jgi:hypothetical protein
MSDDEFVVAVVGASQRDADEHFDAWLTVRGLARASLDPADVRIDTVQKLMGIRFWRYWVRAPLVTGGTPRNPR